MKSPVALWLDEEKGRLHVNCVFQLKGKDLDEARKVVAEGGFALTIAMEFDEEEPRLTLKERRELR